MTTSNPQAFLGQSSEYDLLLKQNFDANVKVGFNRDNWLLGESMGIIKTKVQNGGREHRFLRRHIEDDSQVRSFRDGNTINGSAFGFVEGTITVNNLIDAMAYELGKSQMNLATMEFMTDKGQDLGYAVSRQFHRRALHQLVLAARTSASTRTVDGRSLTFHNGGQRVSKTGTSIASRYSVDSSGAANIRADLEELAQLFDEDDVPREGAAYVFMSPREHRVMLQDTKIFDVQYNQNTSDNNYNNRLVGKVAGFNVMIVNDMPRTNYVDNDVDRYSLDCSTVQPAFIAVRGCGINDLHPLGAVVAQGLTGIVTPMDEKNNTMMFKAEMHYGLGVMHPEVAGVVDISA